MIVYLSYHGTGWKMMTFRTHITCVCWDILFFMKVSYGFSILLFMIKELCGVIGFTVTPIFSTFSFIFSTSTEKLQYLLKNFNKHCEMDTNNITVTNKATLHTVTPKSVYSHPSNPLHLHSKTLQNEVILCWIMNQYSTQNNTTSLYQRSQVETFASEMTTFTKKSNTKNHHITCTSPSMQLMEK